MAESIFTQLKHHKVRVFIIGAGFSTIDGAPVMSNFLNHARELLVNNQVGVDQIKNFERVFEFQNSLGGAQRRFNVDTENIEQLYGIAEWAKLINMGGFGDGNGEESYKALKNLVGETLKNRISLFPNKENYRQYRFNKAHKDLSHIPKYIQDYQKDLVDDYSSKNEESKKEYFRQGWGWNSPYETFLMNLNEDSENSNVKNVFITLNYDTILEHYLKLLDIKFNRLGFSNEEPNLSEFNFYILKPHGSLDWELVEDANKNTSSVRIVDNIQQLQNFDNTILIPPTWSKTNVNGKDATFEIINRTWNYGMSVIHNSYQINILGFSLPDSDQYIRSLIIFGLANNIKLTRINVIDQSDETLNKWRKLFNTEFNTGLALFEKMPILNFFDHLKTYLGFKEYSNISNR